jgi:hypothetical protein
LAALSGVSSYRPLSTLYHQQCPKAAFQHEVITGSPPRILNYNEPEFCTAYPKMLASDFARFTVSFRQSCVMPFCMTC